MCLRLIYIDNYFMNFSRNDSVAKYKQNLRLLWIEMFEIMKLTARTLISEMFPLNEENRYELQNRDNFTI